MKGTTYRFVKVVEGVYAALGTGRMNVGANSAVIVNDQDVLIVDTHTTPAALRAMIEELKTITDKPVRFVVNSHYHYDHAHGNQVFPDDVVLIGHEVTRQMLLGNVLEQYTYKTSFADRIPAQIEDLRAPGHRSRRGDQGTPPDAARSDQSVGPALKEVKPTPPNVTVTNKMTLYSRQPRD